MLDFGSVGPGSSPAWGNSFFFNFLKLQMSQITTEKVPKYSQNWLKSGQKSTEITIFAAGKKYKNFEIRHTPPSLNKTHPKNGREIA